MPNVTYMLKIAVSLKSSGLETDVRTFSCNRWLVYIYDRPEKLSYVLYLCANRR